MEIDLIDSDNFLTKSMKKHILKNTEEILNHLDMPDNTEICISVIDDIKMREFNKNYRNIDRTTDILSFPQNIMPNNNLLGDLVISYNTAERHSKKYRISMEKELTKLLIHGILHLLGYDHKKKKETALMREKENEIKYFLTVNSD